MDSKKLLTNETSEKLKELGINYMHINNQGKELGDADYLNAAIAITKVLKKHKNKDAFNKKARRHSDEASSKISNQDSNLLS